MSDEPKTMTGTMIFRDNRVARNVVDPVALTAAKEALEEYRKIGEDAIKEVKRATGIE